MRLRSIAPNMTMSQPVWWLTASMLPSNTVMTLTPAQAGDETAQTGTPRDVYAQDVKGTLWPLRKNHQDLDEEERLGYGASFNCSPSAWAYTLREELTAIFNRAQTMQKPNGASPPGSKKLSD